MGVTAGTPLPCLSKTHFKGQRLRGRYEKSQSRIFANSLETDMQTFPMEFDTGADIASTPFPVLCQISIEFMDDLKLGKS